MKNIVGLELADITVVTEDGAPSGQKHLFIWNPPFRDAMAPSLGRHSSLSEATGLMRFLMKHGIRVILFCKVIIIVVCPVTSVTHGNQDSEGLRIGDFVLWG